MTDGLATRTVRLVVGLFLACVLLQRLAVPGLPVPLLLPVVLAWVAWGTATGLLEVDRLRSLAWLCAAAATAFVVPVQSFVLDRPYVSFTAWALFVVVWLPFVTRLVDRRLTTYVAALRGVVGVAATLAAGCVVMTATQYAGIPYRDWFGDIVPAPFQLQGFVITYTITYDSPIYRANAWIGLEPSMVSLQLGVGLLAAFLVGSRWWTLLLIGAGLVAATSGSGVAVLAVGLVVVALSSARRRLVRFLLPAAGLVVVGLSTPMLQSIIGRVSEGGSEGSSTSLRAIEPYRFLWPSWTSDLSGVLLGYGPGSSQRIVEQSGVLGLLVPTPVKIFFEYGLLAGGVLAFMLLVAFWAGPSRSMAVGLLISLWTLQPGTTTVVVLLPLLVTVSWWAPRPTTFVLEDVFGPRPVPSAGTDQEQPGDAPAPSTPASPLTQR